MSVRESSPSRPRPRLEDPFANEEGAEEKYRTMKWWHVGILMVAETISLGVLSLPQAVADLGLFPGVLLIVFMGFLATYDGYVIGQFKLAFPGVTSFADAGYEIMGPWGREILGFASTVVFVFLMGIHILSFAIMMNTLTDHATCSVAFGVLGFVVSFLFGLPRTLKKMSYLSISSCISIMAAVIVAMAGISITSGHTGDVLAVSSTTDLPMGMRAALNIILSFAGHVAYFGFASELEDPRDFTKALMLNQVISMTFYCIVGAVIYYCAGPGVASPALSSASPLIRKIAYGLAAPTIVISGVINGHVACKYIYLRLWRKDLHAAVVQTVETFPMARPGNGVAKNTANGSNSTVNGTPVSEIAPNGTVVKGNTTTGTVVDGATPNGDAASDIQCQITRRVKAEESVLHKKDFKALSSWYAICFVLWVISWVISEVVPNFSLLLNLVSSLFTGWFSYGLTGVFWLYMNQGRWFASKRKGFLTVINCIIVLIGASICTLGLWASVKALHDGEGGQPFSCAER